MTFDLQMLLAEISDQRERDVKQIVQSSYVKEQPVPTHVAFGLCQQIQATHRLPHQRMRCAHCKRMGQDGIPARLVASRPGYCACNQVNELYQQLGSKS